MKITKKYIILLIFSIFLLGILILIPYIKLYYQQTPKQIFNTDPITYNSFEIRIISNKLQKKFDIKWFDHLYMISFRKQDIPLLENILNIGEKNLSEEEILPYLLYTGTKFYYSKNTSIYFDNLEINEKNKLIFKNFYCQFGLFVDNSLPYHKAKRDNSRTIISLKKRLEINENNCKKMPDLQAVFKGAY